MSNTKAVKAYYQRMKSKGFRTYSFLIHEADIEAVRGHINDLKDARLKNMVLTPQETIDTLSRLNLLDEEFALIHHNATKSSQSAHIDYLSTLSRGYQENSNNDIVALRLSLIEELIKNGQTRLNAIAQAIEKHPLRREIE